MSKSFGWFCLITAAACLAITVLLISRLHSKEKLVLDRDQEIALLQEQLQEVGHQGSQNEASLKEALDDAVVLRKKVQGLDEQKNNQDQLLRNKAFLQQQLADLQRKLRTQRGRFPRRQLTSSKRGRSLRRAIILTFRTTRNCKPLFVPDTCIRSA